MRRPVRSRPSVVPFVAGLIALAFLVSACSPKTKADFIRADATAYRMAQTIVALEPVAPIGLEARLAVLRALRPTAAIGLESTHVLQAWRPGEPVPPQLAGLTKAVVSLGIQILALFPKDMAEQAKRTAKDEPAGFYQQTPEQQLYDLEVGWTGLLAQIDARLRQLGQ